MLNNVGKVLAGSVIETTDGTLWYSCGDWKLQGITNAVPCIPGYVLEATLPSGVTPTKRIEVGGRVYVKIFGYHGLPYEFHIDWLYPYVSDLIYPDSYDRMVFVRKDKIVTVKNPMQFRQKVLGELPEAADIYTSLAHILDISLECVGISGSVLVIGTPSWRHETDFSIYGFAACKTASRNINVSRRNGTFSEESVPPYHMPFRYRDKWFDPHFSAVERECFLDGAAIEYVQSVGETTLTITDDVHGLFYPVVYGVNNEEKLLSFRSSHRGLYRNGNRVSFSSLSRAVVIFPAGNTENVYLVSNNEWGTVIG